MKKQDEKIPEFSGDEDIPYEIGGFLTDRKVFAIAVDKADWRESYEAPGLATRQITPETKFLIIQASIKNPEKGSLPIPRSLPPIFTLVDERGNEHGVSGNPAFAGRNITRKVLSGSAIHPNLPLKGELVFDVPAGDYSLVVSRGVFDVNGNLRRACDIGRYRLTPYVKKTDENG